MRNLPGGLEQKIFCLILLVTLLKAFSDGYKVVL